MSLLQANAAPGTALSQLLSVTEPYKAWPASAVAALCALGQRLHLPQERAIAFHAQRDGHVYLLESGVVEVVVTVSSGMQQAFGYLHPGAFFGLVHCLANIRHEEAYDYTAAAPCTVWRFSPDRFKELLASEPVIAQTLMGVLCTRLGMMLDTAANYSLLSAEARVARCLLKTLRDGEFKVYWAKSPTPRFDITQAQLARMLGLSRQSVGTILRGFANRGFVSIGRQRIEVLDSTGLRQVVLGSR